MMRSCARRSLEAATIFIAFVICCVFLTARIRRRRSINEGIALSHDRVSRRLEGHEDSRSSPLVQEILRALRVLSWLREKPSSCSGCLSGGEVTREFLDGRI